MPKTHYSAVSLAAMKLPGFPTTERRWRDLVGRESWPYSEEKSRGRNGMTRRYLPPEHVAKLIAKHQQVQSEAAEARQIMAIRNLARAEETADQARRTAISVDQLMGQLTPEGRARFDARYDVLIAWRDWLAEQMAAHPKLGHKAAFKLFVDTWNAGQIKACEAARSKYPTISFRSLERWVGETKKNGLLPVADKRAVKGKGAKSIFEKVPALEKALIGLLIERPGILTTQLRELLNHARKDFETGEVLWEPLEYDAVLRYRRKFEAQNQQALLAIKNPDAWKSKYLSSLGKADGDVLRLNQLWEMDGTPADWELVGGRYTASVVLDVWSRRPMIRFSKTPRTETNKQLLRAAVMAWGVPEGAGTDNGTDYLSREMRLFFDEMGIAHYICSPFSPWQKPHVESFIKTYLHGLLEVLSQFIGHSVAERSELEARQSFAEQLFEKNAVVKVDLTVEEMQRLTDAWIDGTYMHNRHSSLEMTPFERLATNTAPLRRVENERALDVLLAKPAGKRPIISAKGIRYEKAWFIHAELPLHADKEADIRLDPNDMGRLYVHVDGKFLCIAECPERTGINRAEVASHGRALQKKVISEAKASLKKAKKALPMSVDELVKDLVMTRAERAGKLARIDRFEAHTSAGLEEAAKAAAAQDTPPAFSARAEQLIAEAHALMNQFNPLAPVLKLPVKGDRMGADNPLSGFSDEEKYALWHELDAVVKAGGELPHDWQRRFHEGFCNTSKFEAMKNLKEAFGST